MACFRTKPVPFILLTADDQELIHHGEAHPEIKMPEYRRIDRFIESAISDFATWIRDSTWLGKERDCVNIFAARFLRPAVSTASAITDYSQVRVECAVPQPEHPDYDRPAAAKDLVVWRGPLDVAWDSDWKPVHVPWVVIEWKTRRKQHSRVRFDRHDVQWLRAFSEQNPESFGYAVTVDFSKDQRLVYCARFRQGRMKVRPCLRGA